MLMMCFTCLNIFKSMLVKLPDLCIWFSTQNFGHAALIWASAEKLHITSAVMPKENTQKIKTINQVLKYKNSNKGVFRTLSNIKDDAFVKAVTCFYERLHLCKRLHLRCLAEFWIGLYLPRLTSKFNHAEWIQKIKALRKWADQLYWEFKIMPLLKHFEWDNSFPYSCFIKRVYLGKLRL